MSKQLSLGAFHVTLDGKPMPSDPLPSPPRDPMEEEPHEEDDEKTKEKKKSIGLPKDHIHVVPSSVYVLTQGCRILVSCTFLGNRDRA
jgi:hypothetical protein